MFAAKLRHVRFGLFVASACAVWAVARPASAAHDCSATWVPTCQDFYGIRGYGIWVSSGPEIHNCGGDARQSWCFGTDGRCGDTLTVLGMPSDTYRVHGLVGLQGAEDHVLQGAGVSWLDEPGNGGCWLVRSGEWHPYAGGNLLLQSSATQTFEFEHIFIEMRRDEVCNDLDDDCDLLIDEGFACRRQAIEPCTTACGSTGWRQCGADCAWGDCVEPQEICNGIDDNCDGQVDEGFDCVPGSLVACTTPCDSAGERLCTAACQWGDCAPPGEACNGVDDNCDGQIDEGFDCQDGDTQPCQTTCGTAGEQTCVACGWGDCVPPAEACNGVDDDCNGQIDEGTGSLPPVHACIDYATCATHMTCDACPQAPPELCNGADDDCNGLVDDGAGTAPPLHACIDPNSCEAVYTCDACVPLPAETCNGLDDDCDGQIDEDTGSAPPLHDCIDPGTCQAQATCDACPALPLESCNGLDDDCDGQIDEGAGSAPPQHSCVVYATCETVLSCDACPAAPIELCNERDDDCDGQVDEGFDCLPGTTTPCDTLCGSAGVRTCEASCLWGVCQPPAETCNGTDDDCDGQVDEGTGSAPPQHACRQPADCAEFLTCDTCPALPDETCNGTDDDCDGQVDEGTGSAPPQHDCYDYATCADVPSCDACAAPPAEVCNGADDNCDGTIDEGFACQPGDMRECDLRDTLKCDDPVPGWQRCLDTCGWGPCRPLFCGYTQGGWGSRCHGQNPGCFRDQYFDTVFPDGMQVGGAPFAILFTSSAAVEAFLPQGGTGRMLTRNHVDPTSTEAGVFGGQVTALQLNVAASEADLAYTPDGQRLGDAVIGGGPFEGLTIRELLALAEAVLAGNAAELEPYGATLSTLNDWVSWANEGGACASTSPNAIDNGGATTESGCAAGTAGAAGILGLLLLAGLVLVRSRRRARP